MRPLIIIGKGRGHQQAPPQSPDHEIWGICQINTCRGVDMTIDMNDYTLWGENEAVWAAKSRVRAAQLGQEYIDRGNYPLEEVVREFKTDFFSNTVDYAIALAIYRGYKKIDLYGVNMEHETEYAYQRPGVHFWVGMAMGRGIEVRNLGEHSSLMKCESGLIYGYGYKQGEVLNDLRSKGLL